MQIYDVLKNDHEKVKDLLHKLVNLGEKDSQNRHELLALIRDELIPHSRAEETVFYNSLREVDSAKDIALHGYQEHMEAEALLRMLQLRDVIDAEWKENARKLKEAVEHHIQEEEGKIFGVARQLFTDDEAEMLAEAFESLKPEVKTEGFMKTTLDLVTNLMPPRFAAAFRTVGLEAKLDETMSGKNI